MSNSGGKITAPVSINGDISTVLGVANYDLGTLCKSAKINMWAKYKPYKSSSWTTSDADRKNDYFGLTISESGYSYTPPQGGDSQKFRTLDFENYDHTSARGVTFTPLTASKNIFSDKTSFVLTLNKNANQITFYDIRHHPIFAKYNQFMFRISNVTTGVTISRTVAITSDNITLTLTNEDLYKLGAGIVRISCVFSNGSTTNSNLIPDTCVLTITNNTGIVFNSNNTISNLKIGTTVSNLENISDFRTGVGGKVLDLNSKNFVFSTFQVKNGATEAINQSNIYLMMRFNNSAGQAVYTRCPVYHWGAGIGAPSNWSIAAGGQYFLQPYIYSSALPAIDAGGATRGVQLTFQYKAVQNGVTGYYDITSPYQVNLKRTSGVTPTIIT